VHGKSLRSFDLRKLCDGAGRFGEGCRSKVQPGDTQVGHACALVEGMEGQT